MKGTLPILMCDHEDGCEEWLIDNYQMGVTNWRTFAGSWDYDPHKDPDRAFCPKHKRDVLEPGGTTVTWPTPQEAAADVRQAVLDNRLSDELLYPSGSMPPARELETAQHHSTGTAATPTPQATATPRPNTQH